MQPTNPARGRLDPRQSGGLDEGYSDSSTFQSIVRTFPGMVPDNGPCRRKLPAAPGAVSAAIRYGALVSENQFWRRMYSGFALVDHHDRQYFHCRSTEARAAVIAGAVVSLLFKSRRAGNRFIQALDRRHVASAAGGLIDRGGRP